MTDPTKRSGVKREVIAQSPEMRFAVYTLAKGAQIPWHRHTEVSDSFICCEGTLRVDMRRQDDKESFDSVTLTAGKMHELHAPHIHRAVNTGDGICRFALIQWNGKYDFHPADH